MSPEVPAGRPFSENSTKPNKTPWSPFSVALSLLIPSDKTPFPSSITHWPAKLSHPAFSSLSLFLGPLQCGHFSFLRSFCWVPRFLHPSRWWAPVSSFFPVRPAGSTCSSDGTREWASVRSFRSENPSSASVDDALKWSAPVSALTPRFGSSDGRPPADGSFSRELLPRVPSGVYSCFPSQLPPTPKPADPSTLSNADNTPEAWQYQYASTALTSPSGTQHYLKFLHRVLQSWPWVNGWSARVFQLPNAFPSSAGLALYTVALFMFYFVCWPREGFWFSLRLSFTWALEPDWASRTLGD